MKQRAAFTAVAFAAVLIVASAGLVRAEDKKPIEPGPWKFGEVVSLNLSQSSFSTNWAGGDRGSIVWVLGSASTAERQFTKQFNSSSALTLAYGQTSRQDVDPNDPNGRVWSTPDKTTDQILLESTGRFTLNGFADPYVAFRGESQFQDQSNPLGIVNVNPIKLKESAGIAKVLVKADDRETITRLGFGFRQTLSKTLLSANPRTTSSSSENDGGFEWQTNVKQPILQKKVLWTASLLVFQPVFYSGASALDQFDADIAAQAVVRHEASADFWKATDVNFQNTFAAQITKNISVNLFAQLVYDKYDAVAKLDPNASLAARELAVTHNTRKAGQFKETLALGFNYRLF